MKNWIKPDRISFKTGSLEWLNFFGLPTGLLGYSLVQLFFILRDLNSSKNWIVFVVFILTLTLGVGTYLLQYRKLKFKSFKLSKDIETFKDEIKTILIDEQWSIDYDNQSYLQATYRAGTFNLDMITLRYKKSEIQWNLIHHPWSHNSFSALLSLNLKGRKMMEKIKALA